MPQEMLKGTTTRSPRRRFFTEEPISSTVPVNSCPNVQPTRVSGTSPWSRCRSEPQIALRVTLRMASLECSIRGSGLRTTLTLFGQSQRHCIAARLDGQGREVWASTLAGDGESACRAVAFDERTGDIWAAGEFTGTVGPTRAAGLTDAFVVRISGVTGEIRLVHTFGGKGAEHATALALTDAGDVIVAGTFGRDVDASLSQVSFGSGSVRAADGTDGFVVALQPDGTTRWVSVVGEHGDDEVVGIEARESAVYAAANLHRPRDGARCGGQAAILRNRDWVRVEEDECVAARALTFDDAGRLWVLENAGRTLRARAFASTDGAALGTRTWAAERASVRGIGIARVPGGFAAAATTDGELTVCGKPVGSAGERTPFVVWVRDLAP